VAKWKFCVATLFGWFHPLVKVAKSLLDYLNKTKVVYQDKKRLATTAFVSMTKASIILNLIQ